MAERHFCSVLFSFSLFTSLKHLISAFRCCSLFTVQDFVKSRMTFAEGHKILGDLEIIILSGLVANLLSGIQWSMLNAKILKKRIFHPSSQQRCSETFSSFDDCVHGRSDIFLRNIPEHDVSTHRQGSQKFRNVTDATSYWLHLF